MKRLVTICHKRGVRRLAVALQHLVSICHKAGVRGAGVTALIVTVAAVAAGCGSDGDAPTEVVLVTHDSFAVSDDVRRGFEEDTGQTLRILQAGDAGEVVNRALLTAGNPEGDVLFGIDDSLLSRAFDGDLFEEYEPDALADVDPTFLPDDPRVTPIDHGEVCLNVDRTYFEQRDLAPPATLEELTLPRYKGLTVVENAATSSPGLAFLLATIERYGDQWQGYWRKLRGNGVLVVDGWVEAYTQQFSGAAGSPGKRPIVVSYASSPVAEDGGTAAIEDGCFRQVEYAGVLRGAANEDGARQLIDYLLTERFQADVAGSMYVYPVREGVALPAAFEEHAIVPTDPLTMDPERIAANRDAWVDQWTEIVLR